MQRFISVRFISHFQSHNLPHNFRQLKLYSTSISISTDNSFANYLVDSLGFSRQQALSTSSKLSSRRKVNDFNFDANAISVVGFFKTHGFDDTHIRKMVSSYPRLLTYNVDYTLTPKLQCLKDQGFSVLDIIRLIPANPTILQKIRIESCISPSIQFLKQIVGCNTQVIAVLMKLHHVSFSRIIKALLPNVDLLSNYGIPMDLIRKHLLYKPASFMRKPEVLKDITIRLHKKFGIPPESPMFLYAIHVFFGCSEENIESKFQMFKSFGWTQSDIETLMMKNACCFTSSDASIKKKLDFLMNELQLGPAYLTTKSAFLTCSLEKRVMPRHSVTNS